MILQWIRGAERHRALIASCLILVGSICTSQMLAAAENPLFVPTLMQHFPANASVHLEVLDEKTFGGLGDGGRRVLRKTKDKNKASKKNAMPRSEGDPEEGNGDKPKKKEEDNYHVKYETKFAFQNVDEFGLKVKYNKTEHVFYGDTAPQTAGQTPQDGQGCIDSVGRQFAIGQTSNHPGECSLRRCEAGGVFSNQANCEYPPGTPHCDPDLTKPFPECCECTGGGGGGPGFDKLTNDGSIAPMVGEDSLEMIECRKMNFLDYEYVKPIEGMCINCYRGQGTYRYIQGCQRMDCDAFLPTDPTAPYPDCCPACVGERVIEADPSADGQTRMMKPEYDDYGFSAGGSNEEEALDTPDSQEMNEPGGGDAAEATPPDDEEGLESKVSLSYAEPDQFARKLKALQARRRKF